MGRKGDPYNGIFKALCDTIYTMFGKFVANIPLHSYILSCYHDHPLPTYFQNLINKAPYICSKGKKKQTNKQGDTPLTLMCTPPVYMVLECILHAQGQHIFIVTMIQHAHIHMHTFTRTPCHSTLLLHQTRSGVVPLVLSRNNNHLTILCCTQHSRTLSCCLFVRHLENTELHQRHTVPLSQRVQFDMTAKHA